MRFAVVSAFLPTEEIAPVAVAADELGYDGLTIADHVVDLETLATPYPYTASGSRRWDETCEWPDPWVLVGALSAVTTRLRFFTSIYVAAMRSPYQVAKSVGTAAVLSGGRVALGVGVGWCREEFDLLEQDFAHPRRPHRRGAGADARALGAGLDVVRRRALPDAAARDAARAAGAGADPGRRAVRRGAAPSREVRRLGRRHLHDRRGDRDRRPAAGAARGGRARRAVRGDPGAQRRDPARRLRPRRRRPASPR